jgi:hypothetical protein
MTKSRTAEAFAGGWFHSGDLATIDEEGYITVVDRKKDVIKTGGENVASREVEETIYRLPQVSEVAVVGVPHPRWVEAVLAVIVVKQGHSPHRAGCPSALHLGAMASFKSPKGVVFVNTLPKNPSGKILKRQLRRGPPRTLRPRVMSVSKCPATRYRDEPSINQGVLSMKDGDQHRPGEGHLDRPCHSLRSEVAAAILIMTAGVFIASWVGKALLKGLHRFDLEPPMRMLFTRIARILIVLSSPFWRCKT